MNRIERLFKRKNKKVLSVYFTAGYPELNDTVNIISELSDSGADMAEIGIPFSDPVADGPVIQQSSEKALLNGMSLKLLFEQLKEVRNKTDMPLVLMGYINPINKFGIEKFLIKCSETGIDGTIIPDLPPEEYMKYKELFGKYKIANIFLITPQTPDERIHWIDSVSEGFIYMVSTASTTGAINKFDASQTTYFKRIQDLRLTLPVLTGFGVSNNATFEQACEYSNGAITGSAFIKALDSSGTLKQKVGDFILNMKG